MAQSLAQILVHVIFSTKDRYPFLAPEIRSELHAYSATVLAENDCQANQMNSLQDHVHVLCRLSKTLTIADLVKELKVSTSKWIKTKGGMLAKFQWQSGYGAFSVSPSQVAAVRRYIQNQEEHHRRVTFQDEFREFLRRHELEFDERYVWD